MATYSSILAWEIPWTEGLGGLVCRVTLRARHNFSDLTTMYIIKKYVCIYLLRLCGAFVRVPGLSLAAASRGCSFVAEHRL